MLGAVVLLVWCLIGAVTMLLARAFRSRLVEQFPLLFHSTVARLFGLRTEVVGEPCNRPSTLYASNHVSYMDVFVLGGSIKGCFVAKSEVASWPLFGKLARLQNTLFLERRAQRAADQIGILKENLAAGTSLILFPEGTSTAGNWVAPFRSSLFAAAEDRWIQPVTVAYLDYQGKRMSQSERDHYAWYLPDPKGAPGVPNSPFAKHFFNGLGIRGGCAVQVIFHDPVLMAPGARKETAAQCEQLVRAGLDASLNEAARENSTEPGQRGDLHGVYASTQSTAP